MSKKKHPSEKQKPTPKGYWSHAQRRARAKALRVKQGKEPA
jgi:hypothetical protein